MGSDKLQYLRLIHVRYKVFFLASISTFLLFATWVQWLPFKPLEMLGLITGTACVVLAIKQKILNFPTGIVSNICFMILFFKAHLYGIMGVQIVFLLLGIHGWYHWGRQNKKETFIVSTVPFREAITLIFLGVPVSVALYMYLKHIGGALPYLDAITTVLSLSAQFLLNMKRVENWAVGIMADIIYIAIYLLQGLYLTMGLYIFYLIMCIIGYKEWKSIFRSQSSH